MVQVQERRTALLIKIFRAGCLNALPPLTPMTRRTRQLPQIPQPADTGVATLCAGLEPSVEAVDTRFLRTLVGYNTRRAADRKSVV